MTAIWITSAFSDNGTPKAGLSPAITIYDLSDNSVAVNAAAMSEIANGLYKYSFATYNNTKDYAVYVDGGVALGASDRYQYFSGSWDGLDQIIDGNVNSVLTDTDATIPGLIAGIDTDVLNAIVEGGYTVQDILKFMVGGGTPTITFRDLSDTLDRITATVNANGNRTTIVLDNS
jgi:hypothetical protein